VSGFVLCEINAVNLSCCRYGKNYPVRNLILLRTLRNLDFLFHRDFTCYFIFVSVLTMRCRCTLLFRFYNLPVIRKFQTPSLRNIIF
jgi:hypothetical protein